MIDKTDTALNEAISSMIDGEANELDVQRVLKTTSGSDEVRDLYRRYHLQSALRTGDVEPEHMFDLSSKIRDAIEEEDTQKMSVASHWRRYVNGIGKTAVAASVAFAFVLGVQLFNTTDDVGSNLHASNQNSAAPSVRSGYVMPPLNARTVSSVQGAPEMQRTNLSNYLPPASADLDVVNAANDPVLREYLNRLFLKHSEQASVVNGIPVMPLGRSSRLSDVEE